MSEYLDDWNKISKMREYLLDSMKAKEFHKLGEYGQWARMLKEAKKKIIVGVGITAAPKRWFAELGAPMTDDPYGLYVMFQFDQTLKLYRILKVEYLAIAGEALWVYRPYIQTRYKGVPDDFSNPYP